MFSLLLLPCLFSLSMAFPSFRGTSSMSDDTWLEFKNFIQKYKKEYSSMSEMESRFEVFRDNVREIVEHNANIYKNFTMDINAFTDLTRDEFKEMYVNGLMSRNEYGSYSCKEYSTEYNSIAYALPSSIDWRSKGAVTPVKDQGQCGSCWSFSSSGAMEGAWAISTGKLVSLSEQELVDCATGLSYGSHGCNGGQMDGAFKYAISYGMCAESEYPYVSGNTKTAGTCQKCSSVAKFTSCSDVASKNQASLKQAVAQQPVSVAIEADTRYFQSYSSGVLTSSSCGTTLDHGVLVVGYGTENVIDYWLLKNSWGTTWGEDGYVKIGRSDSTNDAGICGIAIEPSFPSV